MSQELTTPTQSLDELRQEFMADGARKAFPARFEIRLGNTPLDPTSTPLAPKAHPDFMKLFLIGHEYIEDGEYVNYKREVDLSKTEFLILEQKSQLIGSWDADRKVFTSFSPEVGWGEDFVVYDEAGNEIYRGGWSKEEMKRLGCTLKTILWVMPVIDGKVSGQMYRWQVNGDDHDSFKGSKKEIMDAKRNLGVFLGLRIHSIEAVKLPNGNNSARIFFLPGKPVDLESALRAWKEFKVNYKGILKNPNYLFQKNVNALPEASAPIDQDAIVEEKAVPKKIQPKADYLKSKKELKEDKQVEDVVLSEEQKEMPWEKEEREKQEAAAFNALGEEAQANTPEA